MGSIGMDRGRKNTIEQTITTKNNNIDDNNNNHKNDNNKNEISHSDKPTVDHSTSTKMIPPIAPSTSDVHGRYISKKSENKYGENLISQLCLLLKYLNTFKSTVCIIIDGFVSISNVRSSISSYSTNESSTKYVLYDHIWCGVIDTSIYVTSISSIKPTEVTDDEAYLTTQATNLMNQVMSPVATTSSASTSNVVSVLPLSTIKKRKFVDMKNDTLTKLGE